MSTLDKKYQELAAYPKEVGTVRQLGLRPTEGVHQLMQKLELSPQHGVHGDRWANGSWVTLDDGSPDPRVQVSVTNSQIMTLIAGDLASALDCGDNLFIDFDLSETNLPTGSRLQIGDQVVLEVSDIINDACGKFIQRFGVEAYTWIRKPENASLRLRGLFCSICQQGTIHVGDTVRKL